jgi:hypothetical protein
MDIAASLRTSVQNLASCMNKSEQELEHFKVPEIARSVALQNVARQVGIVSTAAVALTNFIRDPVKLKVALHLLENVVKSALQCETRSAAAKAFGNLTQWCKKSMLSGNECATIWRAFKRVMLSHKAFQFSLRGLSPAVAREVFKAATSFAFRIDSLAISASFSASKAAVCLKCLVEHDAPKLQDIADEADKARRADSILPILHPMHNEVLELTSEILSD